MSEFVEGFENFQILAHVFQFSAPQEQIQRTSIINMQLKFQKN